MTRETPQARTRSVLESTDAPGVWKRTVTRLDPEGRPKGKPTVSYKARYRGADGKERSQYFATLAKAKEWRAMQLADRSRGRWIDPSGGRITVGEWAALWLDTVVHLRPNTRRIYETNLRLHVLPRIADLELGRVRLDSVTPDTVRTWLAALMTEPMTRRDPTTGEPRVVIRVDPATGEHTARLLSPATVHQAYRTINAVMQAAVDGERIAKNPVAPIKPPRVEAVPMRFLTPGQVMRLADAVGSDYRALVLVAAFCGLRRGELAGLRWTDVDLVRRRINIAVQLDADTGALSPLKTKASQRTVSMPTFVAAALETHEAIQARRASDVDRTFVFGAPGGGPLDTHNFRARVWIPAAGRAGLAGLRLHDLRHTCASLAIAAGADIKVIQRMLGHTSAAMTLDRYGHLMPGQSELVADRLDDLVASLGAAGSEREGGAAGRAADKPRTRMRFSPRNEESPRSIKRSTRGFAVVETGVDPVTPRFSGVCSAN